MHVKPCMYVSSLLSYQLVAGVVCSKTIRDNIIPHAVSLFTGEVVERGTDWEDLDDDDDLKDDYHFDADDDENTAEERHTKFHSYEYECCAY